jgi:hypothetical protein
VFRIHPDIPTPYSETRLWRYMDVTKLIFLLSRSALYFPRSDLLGDPWEGSASLVDVHLRKQYPPEMVGGSADLRKEMTQKMFLSCWHQNEHQSAAMWKLYLKSDEGIAIRTTCDRLRRCFKETTHDIFVGEVKYVDYQRFVIGERNVLPPFFVKRLSFAHEREVRAVISSIFHTPPQPTKLPPDPEPFGITLDVNLDFLVEGVFVAPGTQDWVRDAIQSILEKFGLDRIVQRSSISDSPVF